MRRLLIKNRQGRRVMLWAVIAAFPLGLKAQLSAVIPTTAQAHSHNDYLQQAPFWRAYHAGFGSIEADVFLKGRELMVAHEEKEITSDRTLDVLYLKPLQDRIRENQGYIYGDTSRRLQLMIDIKSDAIQSLDQLIALLKQYPELTSCSTLQLVITGNRPDPDLFSGYPQWLFFDGNLDIQYSAASLDRVALFSDNFKKNCNWNGKGRLPESERNKLMALIGRAHRLNKKIRFWNAPDAVNSWYTYLDMGIDFINTDHIEQLSAFLKTFPRRY